jgi:hypothetical protein
MSGLILKLRRSKGLMWKLMMKKKKKTKKKKMMKKQKKKKNEGKHDTSSSETCLWRWSSLPCSKLEIIISSSTD